MLNEEENIEEDNQNMNIALIYAEIEDWEEKEFKDNPALQYKHLQKKYKQLLQYKNDYVILGRVFKLISKKFKNNVSDLKHDFLSFIDEEEKFGRDYESQDELIQKKLKKLLLYKNNPIFLTRSFKDIGKEFDVAVNDLRVNFNILLKEKEKTEKVMSEQEEQKRKEEIEELQEEIKNKIKENLDIIVLAVDSIDREDQRKKLKKEVIGYDDRALTKYINDRLKKIEQKELEKQIKEKREKRKTVCGVSTKEDDKRIKILLPQEGKVLVSEFAEKVSEVLKDKNKLFYRINSHDIVEVGKIKLHKTGKEKYMGFINIKPSRFKTLVERYITPGNEVYREKTDEWIFRKKSMSTELSNDLLCSDILEQSLPQIERIFNISYPVLYKDLIVFPNKGFDKRLSSWLPYDAPTIINQNMSLRDAKIIIDKTFRGFCWKTKYDKVVAISGLLTPFLKGLLPSFNTRTPIFFYLANRERIGKDYLAGITGIVYEGQVLEDPPISYEGTKNDNSEEELRKKITAALIHGRQRMHFSNCKGFINNALFEQIATALVYEDRILGRNELVKFDNELCLSLSGNIGIGFTPDFANRCRFVNLAYFKEDANARKFEEPYLQEWVLENRELILSALYSLVKNWVDKGKPKGSLPFASYPRWAEVCGRVMESAGYDNPCKVDKETLIGVGGDTETESMKRLYELCYKEYPNQWIKQKNIREVVNSNDLFNYLDLSETGSRSDFVKFGKTLSKFLGREFSGIKFLILDEKAQSQWKEFKFEKTGGNGK